MPGYIILPPFRRPWPIGAHTVTDFQLLPESATTYRNIQAHIRDGQIPKNCRTPRMASVANKQVANPATNNARECRQGNAKPTGTMMTIGSIDLMGNCHHHVEDVDGDPGVHLAGMTYRAAQTGATAACRSVMDTSCPTIIPLQARLGQNTAAETTDKPKLSHLASYGYLLIPVPRGTSQACRKYRRKSVPASSPWSTAPSKETLRRAAKCPPTCRRSLIPMGPNDHALRNSKPVR